MNDSSFPGCWPLCRFRTELSMKIWSPFRTRSSSSWGSLFLRFPNRDREYSRWNVFLLTHLHQGPQWKIFPSMRLIPIPCVRKKGDRHALIENQTMDSGWICRFRCRRRNLLFRLFCRNFFGWRSAVSCPVWPFPMNWSVATRVSIAISLVCSLNICSTRAVGWNYHGHHHWNKSVGIEQEFLTSPSCSLDRYEL